MKARLDKLARIRELGINPYPYSFERTHYVKDLFASFDSLEAESAVVKICGRLIAFRRQGKTAFANLKDSSGRIQIYCRQDVLGDKLYELFKCLDFGDFVGITGNAFKTHTGERSVNVTGVEILSKSIRPLPVPKEKIGPNGEKTVFDEFKDLELRSRQRYLDLALNDATVERFRKRTAIVQSIRQYLIDNGFFEVETPTLQAIYGGASARPFITKHNTLDMDLYLRISNELYLKRLVVGGFEKVFEFVKDFRNEGIDRTHNPEFTQVEFYESYADYNRMMEHFEQIYSRAALAATGSMKIIYEGTEIDLTPPWERLTMYGALKKYAGIDAETISDDEIKAILKKHGAEIEGQYIRGLALSELFEVTCERHLIQPVFITDHPRESTPLCKVHRSNPALVERFEPYINSWEIGNAYSELNDPILQRQLLIDQVERGRGGEDETHPMDEDFIRAMEYGMPPTGGVGIGVDRMVMLLTDTPNIRDAILFPLLRPE
ncbi:MAG: lysine--tRNA ligase [Fibrobacteres bacterium]|nr:lysine--tRNA ligase [Fibrobacterota bacterium]